MNTDKEQTMEEKAKIFDILKFTPCTYKIRLWGYGGEVVLGEIERKQFDYFRDNRINVGDYAFDYDYAEELKIPEDMRPFEPGAWHDCDNLMHVWGVSKGSGTLEIEDENGDVVYTRQLDDLDGTDVMLSCNDEVWLEMKGIGSTVFYNYSSEKGTFFEGDIELKMPFDPEKLCITTVEVEGDELVQTIEYDGEVIDNYGGDTSGKGSDPAFYLVTDKFKSERYANGYDVDENFDDGTPPMGPSPSDWEKSLKISGSNPTLSGWYSCHYLGSNWSHLYWNGEKNVWEDYYNGRVTNTYTTVDWYQGYNWDTSDWNNQPKEPVEARCKAKGCGWTGMRKNMREDDDYERHCPECDSTNWEWIEYDPETKKGVANRKKYMA